MLDQSNLLCAPMKSGADPYCNKDEQANPDSHLEELGFCWVPATVAGAAHGKCEPEGCELIPAGRVDWTAEQVTEVLHSFGVQEDDFQQTHASKEFNALVQELLRGECSLHSRSSQPAGPDPDAVPASALLRVVNLVVLAIVDPLRSCVLVEVKQRAKGKERSTGQLPGKKMKPLQEVEATVLQYLDNELRCRHLLGDVLELEASHVSEREDDELTPSRNFPGLASMYRKYTIQGYVSLATQEERDAHPQAKRLGLDVDTCTSFKTKSVKTGDIHFWEWRPLSADVLGLVGTMDIPTPVPLQVGPRGWSSVALLQLVKQQLQQVRAEGNDAHPSDKARQLEELAAELASGQCSLRLKADGKVLRQVDVIVVQLQRQDGESKKVLCRRDGEGAPSMPEVVKVIGEAPQQVAERFLKEQLGLQGRYSMDTSSVAARGSLPAADIGHVRVRAPGSTPCARVPDCPLLNTVVREAIVKVWI